MKVLAILVGVAVALYLIVTLALPTYSHRYRLTIEIDTPDGVRSGSSVIEVTRHDYGILRLGGARYTFDVRGEAVFVDLGSGQNVVALLAHGPHAESIDGMISLPMEAYGYYKWDEKAWAHRAKMEGPVELKPPLIPTLVTFSNLNDPKTAQVVYATGVLETNDGRTGPRYYPSVAVDRLADLVGPNVRFVRAVLEMTTSEITRGLEKKLPWIAQARAEGRAGQIDGHPGQFRMNIPYLVRG